MATAVDGVETARNLALHFLRYCRTEADGLAGILDKASSANPRPEVDRALIRALDQINSQAAKAIGIYEVAN